MSAELTAAQVVRIVQDEIRGNGHQWFEPTVDVFKAGDPDQVVTGVGSTWMSTSYAIDAASRLGCNFLITHEPTFWNHLDKHYDWYADDATYRAKSDLIAGTSMTIWRLHDNIHMGFDPDPILSAFLDKVTIAGGTRGSSGFTWQGEVLEMTLRQFAEHVARCLGTTSVRYVGDPDLPVRKVGLGAHNLDTALDANRGADAVIMGETREWDTFEYYRDATLLGVPRGLVVISHRDLETWGSTVFANWLAPRLTGLPVVQIESLPPFTIVTD